MSVPWRECTTSMDSTLAAYKFFTSCSPRIIHTHIHTTTIPPSKAHEAVPAQTYNVLAYYSTFTLEKKMDWITFSMRHRMRQKVEKVALVSDVLYHCSQIEEHRSFDIDHLRASFHDSTGGTSQRRRKWEDLRKCLDNHSRRGTGQEQQGV